MRKREKYVKREKENDRPILKKERGDKKKEREKYREGGRQGERERKCGIKGDIA